MTSHRTAEFPVGLTMVTAEHIAQVRPLQTHPLVSLQPMSACCYTLSFRLLKN